MYHFKSAGKRKRLVHIAAEQLAYCKDKTGTYPFSSGFKAVAHSFSQTRIDGSSFDSEKTDKLILDELPVSCEYVAVFGVSHC